MPEYIEREAVIAEFHRLGLGENSIVEKMFADGVYAVLDIFPAADVEPVRHGRWIPFYSETAKRKIQYCSECEIGCIWKPNYCPNCGAKMDLKEGQT